MQKLLSVKLKYMQDKDSDTTMWVRDSWICYIFNCILRSSINNGRTGLHKILVPCHIACFLVSEGSHDGL